MAEIIKGEPRSPADFVTTQAFRDAVAQATAEAVAKVTADITAKLAEARASTPALAPDDSKFARTLALEIAQAADAGNRNRRIAPEEVLKREAAQGRMIELIARYRAGSAMPRYELKAGTYLEERWVAPTWTDRNHVQRKTEIGWPGIPNEAMVPVSEEAHEIFKEYRLWIGGPPNQVTHEAGKGGTLRVLHEGEVPSVPHIGRQRGGDLEILGRDTPGEVKQTNVLGTIAKPARQMA